MHPVVSEGPHLVYSQAAPPGKGAPPKSGAGVSCQPGKGRNAKLDRGRLGGMQAGRLRSITQISVTFVSSW